MKLNMSALWSDSFDIWSQERASIQRGLVTDKTVEQAYREHKERLYSIAGIAAHEAANREGTS